MGNVLSSSYTYEDTVLDLGAHGSLRGTLIDNKVRRFTAVPYAQPPVGASRWKRTTALPEGYVYRDGEGPRDCTGFGAVAWQNAGAMPIPQEEVRYSEDCLLLNIWMPVGDPPVGGWPVVVWYHGGFLQMGNPCSDSMSDPAELVSAAGGGLDCIYIAVGYRLNVFGFLASRELAHEGGEEGWGNYGLWDQCEAMRWLQRFGQGLGADVGNVTLAGLSAGAYSVHSQAVHALLMADDPVVGNSIKRLAMHSNAIPTNPKSLADVQPQFDELLAVHGISGDLSGEEKLAALRGIDAKTLTEGIKRMKAHMFRAVADGSFFPVGLMERCASGEFGREFEIRGMSLLIGEVANEECTYRMEAPKEETGLRDAIANLYPLPVTDKLLKAYVEDKIQLATALPDPNPGIGPSQRCTEISFPTDRLLVKQLRDAGVPLERVHRYLVAWKPSFVRRLLPDVMGVPHGSDGVIWNYGIRHGPTEEEQTVMKEWIGDLAKFVHGEPLAYGTHNWNEMKQLGSDGRISIVEDRKWDYLLQVAQLMAGDGDGTAKS